MIATLNFHSEKGTKSALAYVTYPLSFQRDWVYVPRDVFNDDRDPVQFERNEYKIVPLLRKENGDSVVVTSVGGDTLYTLVPA